MVRYRVFGVSKETGKDGFHVIEADGPWEAEQEANRRGLAVDASRTRIEQERLPPHELGRPRRVRQSIARRSGGGVRWILSDQRRIAAVVAVVLVSALFGLMLIGAAAEDARRREAAEARARAAEAASRLRASTPPPPPPPRVFLTLPFTKESRIDRAVFAVDLRMDRQTIREGTYIRWQIKVENLSGERVHFALRPVFVNREGRIGFTGEPEVGTCDIGTRWVEGDDLIPPAVWGEGLGMKFEILDPETILWPQP